MLHSVGRQPTESAYVEVDDYIAFNFYYPEAAGPPPVYWIAKPSPRQLLEVRLNPETGAIARVTGTLLGIRHETEEPLLLPSLVEGSCVPVCSLEDWSVDDFDFDSRFVRVAEPFDAVLGPDYVSVAFTSAGPAVRYVAADRMRFGLSEGGLVVSFTVVELTRSERERIVWKELGAATDGSRVKPG
jgi:hypothetical protein